MSAEAKKSYASTLILIALGVLALDLGGRWLILLIPAAFWHGTPPGERL